MTSIKSLITAAVLSSVAVLSFAQTPAATKAPAVPAATTTAAAPATTTAAAMPATTTKKHHAKKHHAKKVAKATPDTTTVTK